MRPYDALTETEKLTISYYLSIAGNTDSAPLEQVLRVWNKNKTRLFKAFGKQLRFSIPITLPKNTKNLNRELGLLYVPYNIYVDSDITAIKKDKDYLKDYTRNEFIADVINFWVNQNYCFSDLSMLSRLFHYNNISKGYISCLLTDIPYHFHDFKCTIKNGMKTIRTIQKVLQATHYPNLELFEQWKNLINKVNVAQELRTNLVFSINPIDFMTMSDNTCNWSSCMSWMKNGCYRGGTLEMMNSNLAIVAYLEAPTSFKLNISETEQYEIPNKSWRSLFYIHKDILLSGKSYPYHNEDITRLALQTLRDKVKETLNWNYQFGIQEYFDVKNIDNNFYMRDWYDVDHDKKKPHHCIFVYTNGMYNDLIESSYPHYFCYRNYVPESKKICLSGPATCICCGDPIMDYSRDICDYDDLGKTLICSECRIHKTCSVCGKTHYITKYHTRFGSFCSDNCANEWYYFPDFKRSVSRDSLKSSNGYRILVFSDKTYSEDQIHNLKENFLQKERARLTEDFIKEMRKNPDFRVYKIPSILTKYGFLNIHGYDTTIDANLWWNGNYFYFYAKEPTDTHGYKSARAAEIEEKIKKLSNRISLLDYLKGEK